MSVKSISLVNRSSTLSLVVIRFLLLVALLVTEILWITFRFRAPVHAADTAGPESWFFLYTSNLVTIGLGCVGAFLVIFRPRFTQVQGALLAHPNAAWWVWLLFHGVSFGVFIGCTALIFLAGTDGTPAMSISASPGWMMGWLTLGSITFILWLLAVAHPHFWLRFIRRHFLRLGACGLVGLASWAGGLLAQQLWRPLAAMTLALTYRLLNVIYADVIYRADPAMVGTGSFHVKIAPECSGYEGMALVTAFLVVYLWLFRQRLRFPHALVLFPIGIVAIWLANVGRIALLVIIGASFSAEVAAEGFHSRAGWITFTLISVGLVGVSHRLPFFSLTDRAASFTTAHARLAAALLLPFLVMVATTLLTSAVSTDVSVFYPLCVLITAATLWHFRRAYRGLGWSGSWRAVAMGVGVFVLWLLLEPAAGGSEPLVPAGLAHLPSGWAAAWLVFRLLGFVILAPVIEELAFRGYLLRKLIARHFEAAPPGQFTAFSFLLSSLLFGLLHTRWLAGALAGMAYALALYRRGYLGDAILAHLTTNGLLAAWVLIRLSD